MTIKLINDVYLGTAKYNEGGGTTINNQDITVTENGIYTADDDYTGLGEVTVNVPQSDIIIATNTTGSAISKGDKVWLEKVSGGWSIILFANISSTSLSGFAESAIADGASGEVKTVLPEQVTITITVDADGADISAE